MRSGTAYVVVVTGRVIGGRVIGVIVVVVVGGTVVVVVVVGGTVVVVVGGTVVVVVVGGGLVGLVVAVAEGGEALNTGGPAVPPAEVGAVVAAGGKLKGSRRKDGRLVTTELFLAVVSGVAAGNRKGIAGLEDGSGVAPGVDPYGSDVAVGVGTVARVFDEFWVDGWPLRAIVLMPTTITTPAMMIDHRQNASSPLESPATGLPLTYSCFPEPTVAPPTYPIAVRTDPPDTAEDPIGTPRWVDDATE